MKRHPAIAATLAFLFLLAWQARAQESLPKLVKKIQPAVATVIAYDSKGKVSAQGSGFFIDQTHLITNYHVVRGASRVEVKTATGQRLPFRVLAEDRAGDLVIIVYREREMAPGFIDLGPVFPFLKITGVMPEVGERVLVIGSPLGLEQTLSDGVVSAVRNIPDFGEILQITTPISPGSSGSPVVNMKGEVIGVATLQIVQGQNLNFAIPGNRALALQQQTPKPQISSSKPNLLEKPGLPIKESESTAKGLFNQGRMYFKAGEYEKAIQPLEQAIRLKSDFPQAYYLLGWSYNKLRQYKEASAAFKLAIQYKPDYSLAYAGQGWTYNQLGHYQEAIEACKLAIRLKRDFADAHYNLGIAYLSLGNRGAALEEYKTLKTLDQKLANDLFNYIYK